MTNRRRKKAEGDELELPGNSSFTSLEAADESTWLNDGTFGIDKVSFTVAVEKPTELQGWTQAKAGLRPPFHIRSVLKSRGVFLELRETVGVWRARIEFNPARWTQGPKGELCPPELVPAALLELDAIVRPHVSLHEPLRNGIVTSVDLSRDFTRVRDTGIYLDHAQLCRLPRSRAKTRVIARPDGPPTVYYGNERKTHSIKVYDKHAQSPSVDPGTLRFEVRLDPYWLEAHSAIKHVEDLFDEIVADSFREIWNEFGLGHWLGARLALEDRVLRDHSDAVALRYLGWRSLSPKNRAKVLSKNSRNEMKRLDAKYGAEGAQRYRLRLDLLSGREVRVIVRPRRKAPVPDPQRVFCVEGDKE